MYTFEHWLYLLLDLYFVLPWLACYLSRPDLRREMLLMGLVGMVLAPLVDTIILYDWWHPLTLGPGPVHVESLLFGFFSIGVTSVAAQWLANMRTRPVRKVYRPTALHLLAGTSGALALMFIPNLLWGLNSSLSTLLACGFLATCIAVRRPDLLRPMMLAAGGTLLMALPGYWLITGLLEPDWFAKAWYLHNLGGYWVLGVPLEEALWYVGTGAAFGTALKCLEGRRMVPLYADAITVTWPKTSVTADSGLVKVTAA